MPEDLAQALAPRPLSRVERTLFWVGLAMALVLAGEIAMVFVHDAATGRALAATVATEMAIGREGALPMGLLAGLPPWLLFQVSLTQDLALGFMAYPAFLLLLGRLRQGSGRVAAWARGIEQAAQRSKAVRRWGPLGVFLFMLMPFLVNGPLVGAVAGRLSGIRTRYLLAPVAGATVVAAAAWTFFLDTALGSLERMGSGLGLWGALGMTACALGIVLWRLKPAKAAAAA